jgi:pimeloyl-ACP methyl ester carboxylesterase
MPAYFISGSCDWVCPNEPIREYVEKVQAVDSDFIVINGPGHNLQYSTPKEFADVVKGALGR